MVLQIQNSNGNEEYVAFERPPAEFTLWSAIPRGLFSLVWATRQVDAITAGDDHILNLLGNLPVNFAYVMADANFTLAMVGAGLPSPASGWAKSINLNLQNYFRRQSDSSALQGDWLQTMEGVAQDDSTISMRRVQPWPTFPLVSDSASGVSINMSTFNNARIVRASGVLNGFISFWQFDLEQIRKFPINSPLPTHAR